MILKSYEIEKINFLTVKKKMFLIYGENNGLKKDIKEAIKLSSQTKNEKVEEITVIENEIIKNEENFYNLIFSPSLFNEKRIVVVHNTSDKIISLIKSIEIKFPRDVFLIFFSDILEKKSKIRNFFELNKEIVCIPCYLDNEKSLEIIATKELKDQEIVLSKESINLIVRKANGDRINLRNELEKIKSYAYQKKKIEHENVKNLVNSSSEIKNEDLINVCLSGEKFELKKILEDVSVESFNQILLLKIMSNKIRRLVTIKKKQKENQTIDSLISSAKPPIFWKEKTIVKKQLSFWKVERLKEKINEINDLEFECKRNPQISKIIFLKFLAGICKEANAHS